MHHWLGKHVYLSAFNRGLSKASALALTFAVSIVVHEVVIWAVLGRAVVPYLALFSLLQLPLARLQRVSFVKGKRLGNLFLWIGLVLGVSTILVLYAREVAGPCRDAGGADGAG